MANEEHAKVAVAEPLTPEQMERYADLVAGGKAELPDGLVPAQEHDLVGMVRSRLRRRLVSLIARQIARDLRSGPERLAKEEAPS
jgi:hypothetical protein